MSFIIHIYKYPINLGSLKKVHQEKFNQLNKSSNRDKTQVLKILLLPRSLKNYTRTQRTNLISPSNLSKFSYIIHTRFNFSLSPLLQFFLLRCRKKRIVPPIPGKFLTFFFFSPSTNNFFTKSRDWRIVNPRIFFYFTVFSFFFLLVNNSRIYSLATFFVKDKSKNFLIFGKNFEEDSAIRASFFS